MDCWCVTAALVAVATYIAWRFFSAKSGYWRERGFPHLVGLPLFGEFLQVALGRCSLLDALNRIYWDLAGKKYGGYMQFTVPMLMIRDPDLINHITIKEFASFPDHQFSTENMDEPILMNLSALKGELWRAFRYKLAPTFTSGKLKMMFSGIVECADEILEHVKQQGGTEIEARILSRNCMLNVIASVAFGLKIEAHKEDEKNQRFVEMVTRTFQPSKLTLIKVLVMRMFPPKLLKLLRLVVVDREITDFFSAIIQDTIKHRKSRSGGVQRNDFLQLMLNIQERDRDGRDERGDSREVTSAEDRELMEQLPDMAGRPNHELTDALLLANTFVFISGGSETTSSGLSFALYELAVNPPVQERLFEELSRAVGTGGFTYQTVTSLGYLDQVINEVLRLHSPAVMLDRVCTEDIPIPGTDDVIKAGDQIIIPVRAIHTDPEYWEDPDTFNPSRFEDTQSITKGTYLPFGAGPRFCIAQRFALLQMKVLTAKVVLNYRLKLNSKTKQPLKFVTNSFLDNLDGGLWLDFVQRNKQT